MAQSDAMRNTIGQNGITKHFDLGCVLNRTFLLLLTSHMLLTGRSFQLKKFNWFSMCRLLVDVHLKQSLSEKEMGARSHI